MYVFCSFQANAEKHGGWLNESVCSEQGIESSELELDKSCDSAGWTFIPGRSSDLPNEYIIGHMLIGGIIAQ